MGSGNRQMIINTRERLVSTDHNRLQAFLASAMAGQLRWSLDARCDERQSGGVPSVGAAVGTPLRAVVISGLQARPEIGTANLFVEPGMIAMVDPDAVPDPDDLPTKFVDDPGVQLAGQLTLTPGAVSTRIDVIECKRTTLVVESDSRDVYNPATGLFAPVSVDKVRVGRLSYRIRTGTPGGGFAGVGLAEGWLPLAVARVPSSATTWNDCDLWDVRPLLADFADGPAPLSHHMPIRRSADVYVDDAGGSTTRVANGHVEVTLGASRLGGYVGTPGAAQAGIDLLASDVKEAGWTATANRPWYVYLTTPHGLPRWAKYTPSTSGARVPGGLRGVPIFTQKAPNDALGTINPAAPLSLPSGTGLGGTVDAGVVAFAGLVDGSSLVSNMVERDGLTMVGHYTGEVAIFVAGSASGAGNVRTLRFDLVDNTTHPANARSVLCRFDVGGTISEDVTIASTTLYGFRFNNTTNRSLLHVRQGLTIAKTGLGAIVDGFDFELPLAPVFPSPNLPGTRRFDLVYSLSVTPSAFGGSLKVLGWRL